MPRPLVALAAYLILITALVRLGTSLYLPALPSMGVELNLSAPQISFTLTACFESDDHLDEICTSIKSIEGFMLMV